MFGGWLQPVYTSALFDHGSVLPFRLSGGGGLDIVARGTISHQPDYRGRRQGGFRPRLPFSLLLGADHMVRCIDLTLRDTVSDCS